MARIPLQSQVAARQSEVQLSPGVFQQTAQATANLLSSAVGAVDMVKQQFDQAQELANQSTISEERRKIREKRGEFQNRMVDQKFLPEEWGPQWMEELKSIETGMFKTGEGKKMPPAVRRVLTEDFQDFAGSSLIEISGAALKENLKRARQNYMSDYEEAGRWGNTDEQLRLAKKAVDDGVITEGQGKSMSNTAKFNAYQADLTLERVNNYHQHLENLENGKYPELSEIAMVKEIDETKRIISNAEVVGINEVLESIEINEFKPTAKASKEDQVRAALEANPDISPKGVKRVMAGINNVKPLAPLEMQKLSDRVDALRELRNDPGKYLEAWHDINLDALSGKSRPGMSDVSSRLRADHPFNYTADANEQRRAQIEAGELKAEREPVEVFARREIAGFTKSQAEISFMEQGKDTNVTTSKLTPEKLKEARVKNLRVKQKIEERGSLLRTQLQREVDNFIANFEGVPTETEMQDFIRKRGEILFLKTSMKKMNGGTFGTEPPEYEEDLKRFLPSGQKVKSKRGIGDGGTDPGVIGTGMLPKNNR